MQTKPLDKRKSTSFIKFQLLNYWAEQLWVSRLAKQVDTDNLDGNLISLPAISAFFRAN